MNPVMGHLTATYACLVRPNTRMATQYDFNMYSFDSDVSVGVELDAVSSSQTLKYAVSLAKVTSRARTARTRARRLGPAHSPGRAAECVSVVPDWARHGLWAGSAAVSGHFLFPKALTILLLRVHSVHDNRMQSHSDAIHSLSILKGSSLACKGSTRRPDGAHARLPIQTPPCPPTCPRTMISRQTLSP